MNLTKALRGRPVLLAVIFWLASSALAINVSDERERARQIAAEADDDALKLEERRSALKKLEESVQLFIGVGEAEEAARALNRAGRLQLSLNMPGDALNSHRKALALLRPGSSPEAEVDSLNGMGAAYLFSQDRVRAEEVLRRALTLSQRSAYPAGEAQALLTLSDVQNYSNHALALQTAQSALTLWQTLNDNKGVASTYAQVGTCYLAQNILPDATRNYELALQLWRDLNNLSEQAGALIMLGFIEFRKGEWQNCISLLTQAQSLLYEEAEPEKMGQIAAGLAESFNEHGMPGIGIVHFQRALDYYRQAHNPHYIWYATRGIGITHYLLGNYSEALTYLQRSLTYVAPDTLQAAQCYQYIGRVYISAGEYDKAFQNLQQTLGIYAKSVNPRESAQVLGLMGQIFEQQGQFKQARQYYRQALESFTRFSDRLNQAAIYYALGQLELRTKNYDAAEDYLKQSIEATENIRRVSKSSDLTAAFSATVYERYEKYIDCLMRKHDAQPAQGFAVRAFETSELARGRSLAELLRATQTNLVAGLDPNLAEQEKSLRQALKVKEDYKVALLGRAYKKEELIALDAELARLEAEYKQVSETIRARYPSYEQITRPAAWDLRQIQEQVIADDQTLLLEYSLGSDNSYVWAVTRDTIRSYDLPARAQITEAAQKVYKVLAAQPDPDTAKELTLAVQELSRLILSPVASELSKRRIIIVADGALHYIPFQVLPTPSADNEPLVANYEIINTPSASILGQLQKEATRRQPAKVLAAFGDPVFASNYAQRKETTGSEQLATMQPLENARWHHALRDIELNVESFDPSVIKPLFYARRELANLRNAASSGETFVASGFTATREQLLSTDLTQYAILHFATHGLLDPRRPENSGLVLSTVDRDGQTLNGFVGLQDIYGLRAPVDLVVLSACQTALGKDVRGEGLLGLTRGFMYAGASSVVASLWKVDDEATAELMRQFYTNMLQKGMTPADGLREAQNSIRQRPEWHAPYYWAGFTLQGEYRQVIKPASATGATGLYWKIIIIGALALLACAALWYRHRRLRTPQESR
jgi:CHAT domain-containing protein/tetratricopeptide (TPR) repeat protein